MFYFVPVIRNLRELNRAKRAKSLEPDMYFVPKGELVLQLRDSTDSLILEKREKITISATVSWEKLLSELTIEQDGNLTVFIDNQDNEPVYFDNLELRVESDPTLVITQEHHYYPFGMNMSGIERQGDLMYQFNGMVEKEEAFGLELYETPFRSYDAQLGRFWQVEPLADEFHSISMFQFAFNNPVSMNDPMGLSPKQQKRDLEGFLLDFFNKSESGAELSGDAFQNAFGAYMNGAQSERGVNSAGEAGYWFDYESRQFDVEGGAGVASKASVFIKSSKAKQSFSFAAWERSINAKFSSFGSQIEDVFGDGNNMRGFAEGVAGLNPLVSAANVYTGYVGGQNIFGEAQGKWGTAGELASLIPGEGIAAKGTAYLGKGMMAALPLLVRTSKNLNSNSAISKFGIYVIEIEGIVHKYGKAHLERITQSSGLPTRLHQQLRKLRESFPGMNIKGRVIDDLGHMTTKQAKEIETSYLQNFFDKMNFVPFGNSKSFTPKN